MPKSHVHRGPSHEPADVAEPVAEVAPVTEPVPVVVPEPVAEAEAKPTPRKRTRR